MDERRLLEILSVINLVLLWVNMAVMHYRVMRIENNYKKHD